MYCMKCGREIQSDESFCEECLADMEAHPVRPNTVVLLPRHRASSAFRRMHQRRHTPEEQIAALEKRCRRLVVALILSLVLLFGTAISMCVIVYEWDMYRFLGKNYHSADETITSSQGSDY